MDNNRKYKKNVDDSKKSRRRHWRDKKENLFLTADSVLFLLTIMVSPYRIIYRKASNYPLDGFEPICGVYG